jgi:hypothetical protein
MLSDKLKRCVGMYASAYNPISQHNQSSFKVSARGLTLEIIPLVPLSSMLLRWQRGELEETALSDSECDEDAPEGSENPVVKYATEEQYQAYVSLPIPLPANHTTKTTDSDALKD